MNILRYLALSLATLCATAHATTITIVNLDGPSEGLNDTRVRYDSSDGFPMGTTLGAKRLAVLQNAAGRYAAIIDSPVEIRVGVHFDPMTCIAGGQFAFGRATSLAHDFSGATKAAVDYPIALAESLHGAAIVGSNVQQIDLRINSSLDDGCFQGYSWFYGTNPAYIPFSSRTLLEDVMHELAHGLGFASNACVDAGTNGVPRACGATPPGGYPSGRPDIWAEFQYDVAQGLRWSEMSDAQRATSMHNDPNLVWTGPNVTAGLPTFVPSGQGLNAGKFRLHAPALVAPGQSVSHWSLSASYGLMMSVQGHFARTDLTDCLFKDIGWVVRTCAFLNQAPTVTAPEVIQVAINDITPLSAISFSDPDSNGGAETVTLVVRYGAVILNNCVSVSSAGDGTTSTLTGTIAALNACFASGAIAYTPNADPDLLEITLNDNGHTGSDGARTATANVVLDLYLFNNGFE